MKSPDAQRALDQSLEAAASAGRSDLVANLLAQGADPSFGDGLALRAAAYMGRPECVELLLAHATLQLSSCRALLMAIFAGHLECVKILLPSSPLSPDDLDPLLAAVVHGHAPIVALMLDPARAGAVAARDLCDLRDQAASLSHRCVVDVLDAIIAPKTPGSEPQRIRSGLARP